MTSSIVHGRGLGRARRLRGLSVEECAELAGVSPAHWRDWEAGEAWPSEVEVRRVFGRVGRQELMRLGAAESAG